MREASEFFTDPGGPAQRRYEALRCYFVEEAAAAEVAARFGYSPATVHQLAAELRAGRTNFFASSRPGPKGPRKAGTARTRVLQLRAQDRSVTDIAETLTAEGTPISAQTVWSILRAEGFERLGRRTAPGPAPRLEPVKAAPIGQWPTGARFDCDHAGLYLLLPAMAALGLDRLISAARYPGTRTLSSLHSVGSLLLLKCARKGRAANAEALGGRPRPGSGPGPGRPAQGHPPHRLLLPGQAFLQRGAPRRHDQTGSHPGPGLRRGRLQLGLPRHRPPRRRGRPRRALRRRPLAAHPGRAHLLRPRPRLHRNGLRQRRYHQSRPGPRSPRLRRLLAARGGREPRPVVLRLQAHHLQDPQRAMRPKHHLPHPAPTPPQDPRNTRQPACLRLGHRQSQPPRPLPPPTAPRRHPPPQRHRHRPTPDRGAQHRPRQPHLATDQRRHHPRQGHLHPLRRADAHRKRARRLHLRVPHQRPVLGAAPQRRPRHDPVGPGRELLPPPGPETAPLRARHPRPDLAALHHTTGKIVVAADHVRVDLALRTYTPALIDAGFPELEIAIPWWQGRKLRFGFPPG